VKLTLRSTWNTAPDFPYRFNVPRETFDLYSRDESIPFAALGLVVRRSRRGYLRPNRVFHVERFANAKLLRYVPRGTLCTVVNHLSHYETYTKEGSTSHTG
jgi:hypothetical protein